MYEIDSPGVPQSAGWKAESDKGDWAEKIRPFTSNRSHITLRKIN
jgi:hypothetical protein